MCGIIKVRKNTYLGGKRSMKLLGKIEESLVFEYERGKYIIVFYDEDSGQERVEVTSNWSNPLGRFAWHFTKCSSDPRESKCLSIISKNKSDVVSRLNELNELYQNNEEFRRDVESDLDELDDVLEEMGEGDVWNWEEDDEDEG